MVKILRGGLTGGGGGAILIASSGTITLTGTINANGTYAAPSSAPAPDAIQVVAISSDDTVCSNLFLSGLDANDLFPLF